MESGVLVSTQVSALFPSAQATSIPIQTSRRNAPLPPPPTESDPPVEHALESLVFHSDVTGTVLLRVIHAGLIVELISLTQDIPPIRFVFPAPVLNSPALFFWQPNELHLLAVTKTASLYRLILPARDSTRLWSDPLGRNWCREYLIKSATGYSLPMAQVQSTYSVAIALEHGSLVRLEATYIGDEVEDGEWSEHVHSHGSIFSTITSLIPSRHNPEPNSADVVAMTSCPQPSEIENVWTLSRDRTLRAWSPKNGCVSAKKIPSSSVSRALTPVPGTITPAKPTLLLGDEPQKLLRAFEHGNHIYVLVFIPTSSSTSSGGVFHLFEQISDQLVTGFSLESSSASVYCQLHDFAVIGASLHTLWSRQGQSVVESVEWEWGKVKKNGPFIGNWVASTYPQEFELTPSYLEELLLTPGSMTAKFYEATMRPGVFSPLTLKIALEAYTVSCLSLLGAPPPQLTTPYATLGENIAAVVGCTVRLTRDPQTGAQQHDKYWNALKRDWEGFIARCREVERMARWPSVLGLRSGGDLIVVERERVGIRVGEDLPLRLHRLLSSSIAVEPQYGLMEILWTLKTKIGTRTMSTLEDRLTGVVQQVEFPYADIILDQAQRTFFRTDLDEADDNWITGRLQSIEDIDQAIRFGLDVLGGLADSEVKLEEEEVEMLLPTTESEWSRALTASFTGMTVNARYDLCLTIIALLYFLAEDLGDWDPSLLAEVLAVFRGLAMLRYVAQQAAGDSEQDSLGDPDDFVSRMRVMGVSQSKARSSPVYSLLHRLLPPSSGQKGLMESAHHFLDSTGLLQTVSPALATRSEVVYCERLRLLGYLGVAGELLTWLPRTPGVTYVQARAWLDGGRADDAALLLEGLAARFGPDSALNPEDRDALAAVLPNASLLDSDFSFYLHLRELFRAASITHHEVRASQLALSVAPLGGDTSELWYRVVKGLTELGAFDDAYATLAASPYDKLKRECVTELVHRMCEENAVEKLVSFNFAGFNTEVEDALSFNARNADPRVRPFYSRILYTWYITRGDYRNAALVMYQRARKLATLATEPSNFVPMAELQMEAYLGAVNALSLVDQKVAWITIPLTAESSYLPRKRRKLSRHIPEELYTPGRRDVEIVGVNDIHYDYTLLSAQLELNKADPTFIVGPGLFSTPSAIVMRLAQLNKFNTAMSTARSLDVDMTELFVHLTSQCLKLSRHPNSIPESDTSDWLLTDRVSSWPGTPAERGWRYLRQSLERNDSADTDFKYTKTTLETILSYDRLTPPPPWLTQILENYHHEYLIRTALRYELFEDALEHISNLIKKSGNKLAREPPKHSASTWLPYTLIDQVLAACRSLEKPSPRCVNLQRHLEVELSNRVKRIQKLSQFPR